MTPQQKIRWAILIHAGDLGATDKKVPDNPTGEQIDNLYDQLVADDEHWDARNETRYGDIETDIEPPFSRNLDSVSVAFMAPDGSWVGWTRWQGGGKHSEPEAIDWISDAYDLDSELEEVVIMKFKKV